MMNLKKRIERLEQKAEPKREKIIVVTGMDGPGMHRVQGRLFHSDDEVRAAYPEVDFIRLHVVYNDAKSEDK